MPRYIDADALMKRIPREEWNSRFAVKNAPTADVVEVKHGEWTIDENDPEHDTYCSRCGFVLDDWIQGELYSFCPNCGADMRGDEQ